MIDVDINAIRLGDLVPCISEQHGLLSVPGDVSTYYLVSKYEVSLDNPANNKITLGRTISTLSAQVAGTTDVDNKVLAISQIANGAAEAADQAAGAANQAAETANQTAGEVEKIKTEMEGIPSTLSEMWENMKGYVDEHSSGEVSSDYTEYRSEGYGFSAASKANSLIKEFTVSNGIYRIEAFTGFAVSTSAMTALYVQSDSTGVMTSECYVRSTMSSGGGMSASCFVDARGKTCTIRVSVYQAHTVAVNTAYNIQVYKEISTGVESGATYQELTLYNHANTNDKISPYGKQYIVYNSEMAFIHFHFNSGNNVSKTNKVIAELPVKVQDVSNICVDTEPSTYNRNKYVVRVNNNCQLCFGSDVPSNTHISVNLILKRFGVSDAPKELPVDYIAEEAHDGAAGWWYRKYNSGYIDMWYKRSIGTLSLTTKFVEGVYSNASWNSVPLSYPFELSDVEHAESNIFSNGYTLSQVAGASTKQMSYRIWSPYSSTPTNCVLSIYLRGKLK